jgi:hypothetical protein
MRTAVLFLLLAGIAFSPDRARAQPDETLRVMAYNLLNFPDPVPAGRADTFRTIAEAAVPDLVLVCELKTAAGADQLLDRALNADGGNAFRRADFVPNTGGGSIHNMAFYRQDKLALYEQAVVRTHLRDINRYTFFFRDPFLAGHRDTVFLDAYMAHFKAGGMPSDVADRARMADSLRAAIDRRGFDRMVIVGGDFNVTTSAEDAYAVLDDPFATVWLRDPANRTGAWGGSSTFADVHTQSTRSASIFGDGSGGGMDDRYDFLLVSSNVLTGSGRVAYVPGSYEAYGNSGNCYNQTIFSCSPNPVPRRVRSALYYMSDHLPVVMDLAVTYPVFNGLAGTPGGAEARAWWTGSGLAWTSPGAGAWRLVDGTGRVLAFGRTAGPDGAWTANRPLPPGLYLWTWTGADGRRAVRRLAPPPNAFR